MTTTLQPFKRTDANEPRMVGVALPTLEQLEADHDEFYEQAYTCAAFGDALWDVQVDALSEVLTKDIYRQAFSALHEWFTKPGPLEFYLEVFRQIFGEDVDVEFTIPAPGKLLINVDVLDTETFDILSRDIVDNHYVYDELQYQPEDENILGVGEKGIKTQDEMNALMYQISVGGIWTVCTLTL